MLRIPIEAAPALAAPAWIDVDLDAIAHNVRTFRRLLAPACRLIAVVKANAYGHGMVRVARTVLANGAAELAVATVPEGALLRTAGIVQPILIAGPVAPTEAAAVVQHGLVPSLGCAELAEALARATRRYLPVHVEVDTGLHRHGVPAHDLGTFVQRLHQRGRLTIAGVYTHFAAGGPAQVGGLGAQLAAFAAAVDGVRALRGVVRHACNTLGALAAPAGHLDAVRIGGGLYGFDPFAAAGRRGGGADGDGDRGSQAPLALRPALSLRARVVGLREAPAGAAIGYGGVFTCARPSRLALLALGYADGLARELWHGASVLVRGARAPIAGAISMNQTVIDVTDVPGVSVGDEVVLLGAQGGERLHAEERVPPGGTVYEVTTLLRPTLPRRYLQAPAAVRDGDPPPGH